MVFRIVSRIICLHFFPVLYLLVLQQVLKFPVLAGSLSEWLNSYPFSLGRSSNIGFQGPDPGSFFVQNPSTFPILDRIGYWLLCLLPGFCAPVGISTWLGVLQFWPCLEQDHCLVHLDSKSLLHNFSRKSVVIKSCIERFFFLLFVRGKVCLEYSLYSCLSFIWKIYKYSNTLSFRGKGFSSSSLQEPLRWMMLYFRGVIERIIREDFKAYF